MVCISVIMPSLNVAPYIRSCVESVLAQTLRDIEILCVDAGSTDGTWEILQELAQRDGRITLIRSDKRSYGYQVNLGVRRASGEYLGIVETDDYIEPDMYERLYTAARAENLDVLKANYYVFTGSGESERAIPCRIARRSWQYRRVFAPIDHVESFSNTLYTWSGVYRTAFLHENGILHNETPGASFQDNGFWFQTFALASRVRYYNACFYHLRRDNPGSSVFSSSKVYCECEEYDFIRAFLRSHPDIEGRLAPVCAYRRCMNYFATLRRIAPTDKDAFLQRFAADFRRIEADGELDRSLFSRREWRALRAVMADSGAYYELERAKALPGQTANRLQGGLNCLREHGLAYTLRYVCGKEKEIAP